MRLKQYLDERARWHGESQSAFAHRADVVQQTLNDLLKRGGGPRGCFVLTAWRIVKASREQPTKYGGTVDWEDLLPHNLVPPEEERRAAS
jgi:hypothetical protein